jgi:putative ABC transport system permease protein
MSRRLPSLARTTLRREWRRFLPAVVAVGFAGLLMLMQLALMLGIFRTVSVAIDQSSADLWVGHPGTPSVDLARPIHPRNEVFIHAHPDVAAVEAFRWGGGDVRRPDGSAADAFLFGIDTRPSAMMFSRALSPAQRRLLDEPDTVLVDVSNADNLGVRAGGFLDINQRRVKVAGFTRGLGAIGGPNIVASLDTARRLSPAPAEGDVAFFLVRLHDPDRAVAVKNELTPRGPLPPFEVWTAEELSTKSQRYWLLETGLGLGFAFSGVLALLIGVVITSQTLKAAITGSLREYATLRALGVSLWSLRAVVVQQAGWIGVIGVVVTSAVTAGLVRLALSQHVLVVAPWWAYAGTAGFVILIALAAGLLALRVLARSEPASLLR